MIWNVHTAEIRKEESTIAFPYAKQTNTHRQNTGHETLKIKRVNTGRTVTEKASKLKKKRLLPFHRNVVVATAHNQKSLKKGNACVDRLYFFV